MEYGKRSNRALASNSMAARKCTSARGQTSPSGSGRVRHERDPRSANRTAPDLTYLHAVFRSIPALIALMLKFPSH